MPELVENHFSTCAYSSDDSVFLMSAIVVTIKAVTKARSYELRYAPVPAAGASINWTTIVVATVKPATLLNNLTPGGTYTFQVRAFGKLGFSDWSDSVNRMCI